MCKLNEMTCSNVMIGISFCYSWLILLTNIMQCVIVIVTLAVKNMVTYKYIYGCLIILATLHLINFLYQSRKEYKISSTTNTNIKTRLFLDMWKIIQILIQVMLVGLYFSLEEEDYQIIKVRYDLYYQVIIIELYFMIVHSFILIIIITCYFVYYEKYLIIFRYIHRCFKLCKPYSSSDLEIHVIEHSSRIAKEVNVVPNLSRIKSPDYISYPNVGDNKINNIIINTNPYFEDYNTRNFIGTDEKSP